MESSSQVDENSDLKNADVIRIQGFTQSLMHRILEINNSLSNFEEMRDHFKKSLEKAPVVKKDEVKLTPNRIEAFNELKIEFKKTKKNIVEKLNIALTLEGKSTIRQLEDNIQSLSMKTHQELKDQIQSFKQTIENQDTSSRRINRLVT